MSGPHVTVGRGVVVNMRNKRQYTATVTHVAEDGKTIECVMFHARDFQPMHTFPMAGLRHVSEAHAVKEDDGSVWYLYWRWPGEPDKEWQPLPEVWP